MSDLPQFRTRLPNMGRRVSATYNNIPHYLGGNNPYVDALPMIPSTKADIVRFLIRKPELPADFLSIPSEHRIMLVDNLDRFFFPSEIHVRIFRAINNTLRKGYMGRTPVQSVPRIQIEQRAKEFADIVLGRSNPKDEMRILADAIQITGASRVGKSTAVDLSLSFNPQVIDHVEYKNQPLLQTQIVYVNTTCPDKGRVKSLCYSVLHTADLVAGTDYRGTFVQKGRAGLEHLLMGLVDLASSSALGILAVDETQLLAGIIAAKRKILEAKTSNERAKLTDELLNVLVGLDNTLGVPVIYIGTPLAKHVFATHFRSMARSNRLGSFDWDFMARTSTQWEEFVLALAELQFVRQPAEGNQLFEVLHECSAGIAGIAVMVFRGAQKYLLENEQEELTPEVIRHVFETRFPNFQEPIKALLNNDNVTLLIRWEDLVTENFVDENAGELNLDEYSPEELAELGLTNAPAMTSTTSIEAPSQQAEHSKKPGRPKSQKKIDDATLDEFIDKFKDEPLEE
jgi:hypothetical protein